MAVEYGTRRYSFVSELPDGRAATFAFNFYHDIESLLWVFAHYVLTRLPSVASSASRLRETSEHITQLHDIERLQSKLFDFTSVGTPFRTLHTGAAAWVSRAGLNRL